MEAIQQTISITRALATLKSIDADLSSNVLAAAYVSTKSGQGAVARARGGRVIADVEREIQGNFDRVDNLMKRRAAIKAAIVASNAYTFVTVAGERITVAAAIELKTSVESMKSLLQAWKQQLLKAEAVVDAENAQMQNAIDATLTSVGGANKVLDAATIDAITAPQKAAKEASLIDPHDIRKRIESMDARIKAITLDLDYELSESNAKTVILVAP